MARSNPFVLFVLSAFTFLAGAQLAPPPDPQPWYDPEDYQYYEMVLDAQKAVWDHTLGEGNWSTDDYTVPLDGEPIMGQWGIATSNATGDPIVFHYNAVIEGDFDDPFDDDIPADVLDWAIANGYTVSFVFGRAYGPVSGPVPIGFAGLAFGLLNQSGAMEWRVVVFAVLEFDIVDALEEMESMYLDSVSLFGDLIDGSSPPPPGGILVVTCINTSATPDADFNTCAMLANSNFQCRRNKFKQRLRRTVDGAAGAGIVCLIFPPSCIPSGIGLGVVSLCLKVQEFDIVQDYHWAIDCCCIALDCRDQGGTSCPSSTWCNSVGCDLPTCLP